MGPAPWMLVLQLLLADGRQEQWFVVDFGLSRQDCEELLYAAPLPVVWYGTSVAFSCQSEGEAHEGE
jgi:hypothetical protein